MKKIIIVVLIALSVYSCQEKNQIKLEGKYSIEFIANSNFEKVEDENSNYIIFTDSTFSTRLDCNSIQGKYALNENKVKLDVLLSTRMLCPNDLENKYLMALSESDKIKVNNGDIEFYKEEELTIKIKANK